MLWHESFKMEAKGIESISSGFRGDDKHAVILIHGTWGANADWVQTNSLFRNLLLKKLGEHFQVFSFRWEGKNLHDVRISAVSKLVEFMEELRVNSKISFFHLVGHSHGGNIAIGSLRNQSCYQRILSVTTLSTPFFVAQKRYLGVKLAPFLEVTFLSAAVIFLLIVSCLVGPKYYLIPPYMLIVLASRFITKSAANSLAARITKSSIELQNNLSLNCDTQKLLVIRSPGDEANLILTSAQAISQAALFLWRNWAMSHGNPETSLIGWRMFLSSYVILMQLIAFIVFKPLVMYAVAQSKPTLTWGFGVPAEAVVIFCTSSMGILALPLSALILFMTIYALINLCLLPFGIYAGLGCILIDVTVEQCPPGQFHFVQIDTHMRGPDELSPTGMIHSATWASTEAIQVIADWIVSRAR